jgi:FKBP-type peptidyl-prolyl cis-trans isomerase 2
MEEIRIYDFVEIDYTGFVDGKMFDTTKQIKDVKAKPLKICIGLGMILKGLHKALVGKKEKSFRIKLKPEEAFGKRKQDLVKTFSLNSFEDKSILRKGMLLNVDGLLAKVVSSSSGRVILDVNDPLAGREVEYEVEIRREITDDEEKIKTILEWCFKGIEYIIKKKDDKFEIEIKDKDNKILDKTINIAVELIKRTTGLDVAIKKLQ